MRNVSRWLLIVGASGLVAALVIAGLFMVFPVFAQGPGWMMGGYGYNGPTGGYGPGWMQQRYPQQNESGAAPYHGPGWMMGRRGPGGMMGRGMMGRGMGYGYGPGGGSAFFNNADPLSVEAATETVNRFLTTLNNENLELAEVMIFDNHAYAQIVEKDTGIGAMELLVDPVTQTVYPEMGPNMMWNLKYGMHSGYGMPGRFGLTPGQSNTPNIELSAEMPVTTVQAVEAAQTYLANYVDPNLTVDDHAQPFYGYYTLHVEKEGQIVGMLSVNGYNGQVFLHTWHGNYIEMSQAEAH